MSDFERLVEFAKSEDVETGVSLPKAKLHSWLVLGQTEYLCENGTLSDGHEKFTDAQKYAQSLKELYYISLSVKEAEAAAMLAQADLLEARDDEGRALTPADRLRSQAKQIRAQTQLASQLTAVEDKMRMVRFYARKVKELGAKVEAQYPGGIETAEQDNWEAVARYRLEKEKTPGLAKERLDHIPLPAERKAILGYASGRMDAIAPLMISNESRCREIAQAFERAFENQQKRELESKELPDGSV